MLEVLAPYQCVLVIKSMQWCGGLLGDPIATHLVPNVAGQHKGLLLLIIWTGRLPPARAAGVLLWRVRWGKGHKH
jgi:hypothetical protein